MNNSFFSGEEKIHRNGGKRKRFNKTEQMPQFTHKYVLS